MPEIRKINKTETFAELFGVAEKGKTNHVDLVRILAVGNKTGKVVGVFNVKEIRDGVECGRPRAWGMPGGTALPGENAYDAIMKHESGEIPWKMVGNPVLLRSMPIKDCGTHTEQVHLFYVEVDEDSPIEITKEEAKEISHAEFFDIHDISRAPTVNPKNQNKTTEELLKLHEFYYSHKEKFFPTAWREYMKLKAKQEEKPKEAQ